MYARMITAHRALSIRQRGSNSSGTKLPERSLGIADLDVTGRRGDDLGRCPLRCAVRSGVRSPGSAPIRAVGSASISSCNNRGDDLPSAVLNVGSVPVNCSDSSALPRRPPALRVGWERYRWSLGGGPIVPRITTS